ncbi:hypothetical protein HZS_2556 [Henneguya salminicola]|nr:hypothetical protein HZS_2556 [Henneguya salminicola]
MEGNPSKYFIGTDFILNSANFCNGISKENTETRFEFSGTENQKTPIVGEKEIINQIAKIGNVEFQSNIMENKYSRQKITKSKSNSGGHAFNDTEITYIMNLIIVFIEDKQKNDDRPYVEKNLQLVEEFGSTKMKRDARSRKRKLDISTAAASTIESNVERLANITLENPIERIIDESEIIFPVKNSNAKKIEEIFNIDDCILFFYSSTPYVTPRYY